ncbi:MAG: acetylornithine deacetylase or succinyl-diaminopimelate desuccinylase [Gemmatimonadetes bacterium]|nr:acetylornithine deacetylase or succinyl-diaminopimelate desuccinylase [Gemmatimonadota bacterium]
MTPVEQVAPGDARALAASLVRIDSRNPSLAPGAPGEAPCVALLRDVLDAWGFRTEVHDAAPGRPNLVARIGGATGGRSLMFSGHLDVVGVEGMVHAPFTGTVADDRLYGRGATDMKGGIGAMCAAAWRAAGHGLTGEIIVAATADEEYESIGTRAMLEQGVRADAAIVGEPTCLDIMPAHRGFVWVEVEVSGRAAHGSRWDIGVDAIRHAGLLLAELDRVDAEELPLRVHPLLGRGSLHASLIDGGIGMSTYPDRCVLRLERRTLPGESGADVVAEVERACDAVRARRTSFSAAVRLLMAQGPSDVAEDAPIVRELGVGLRGCGEAVRVSGMSAWTDAALLNAAGIPAVCFGPGDISLAHAAEEYIPLTEIDRATAVLAAVAQRWCV